MKTSVRTTSVQELHQRQTTGEPIALIDVRTAGEFASGHVPGARNVPLGSPALQAILREGMDRASEYFVICQSGGRSRNCCEAFAAAGMTEVTSVEGGTAAWAAAGFPLERSAGGGGVISLERQVRIAAGLLIVTGCALGWWVHPGFFGLAAFVGAGLTVAGLTDFCGMGLLLARMPWNRG